MRDKIDELITAYDEKRISRCQLAGGSGRDQRSAGQCEISAL